MTRELQLTFEAYRIGSPALSHHIACMAQVIQITLGPFLRSLGAKGHTKSWDAHECDHHFGENARTVIRKGQILRHEGTARMNKVCAMAPGLAKLIEKVHRKRHFESSETNIHIAENACCTDYSDTWSSKRVHWLPKAKLWIKAQSMMDLKSQWKSTLELFEWANWFREFTDVCLKNPKYSNYRTLFTT